VVAAPRAGPPAPSATFFDRVVEFPELQQAEYVYVETVRELGRMRHTDDFTSTEAVGLSLMAANGGYGFGGVVRDSLGRPVTPRWLSAGCVAVDGSRLSLGATISHLALEHGSTALDLGARDGRNAIGWTGGAPQGLPRPNANLFLGDVEGQWLELSELGGDIGSLDISPDGRRIAQTEWWAGIGALVVVDATAGHRTILGTLDNLGAAERVRFSPDGRYILVTRWSEPAIVDATSGEVMTLPINGDIAWWPARGPSTLLWLDQHDEGHGVICSYDISSGVTEKLQPITYPEAPGLALTRYRINHPEVDPTGTKALCGTYFGVRPELQEEHGSRERVSLLDLETGAVTPLVDPHVGADETLEREHRSWRWLRSAAPPIGQSTTLAPEVVASIVPARTELGSDNYASAADQAFNLTIACMRTMVGDSPGQTNPYYAPEALRTILAMTTYGADRLAEIASWLEEVAGKMPIFAPAGETQKRWQWFSDGWYSIVDGMSERIPWRGFHSSYK